MAYTDLTCDDHMLPLEELFRRAIVQNADGTWSLQTVEISGGGGDSEGFDYEFDLGLN